MIKGFQRRRVSKSRQKMKTQRGERRRERVKRNR